MKLVLKEQISYFSDVRFNLRYIDDERNIKDEFKRL